MSGFYLLVCQNAEQCIFSTCCVTMVKYNQNFTVVNGTPVSAGWEWFLVPVAVCKAMRFRVKHTVWVFSLQPLNAEGSWEGWFQKALSELCPVELVQHLSCSVTPYHAKRSMIVFQQPQCCLLSSANRLCYPAETRNLDSLFQRAKMEIPVLLYWAAHKPSYSHSIIQLSVCSSAL